MRQNERSTLDPGLLRRCGAVAHQPAVHGREQFALTLASGRPVEGVTWDDIHALNAQHAKENDRVTKDAAIEALRKNSETASAAVRSLSDVELDTAAAVSLNDDAPLTCQFFIEDHALRHSYHHLAVIRKALRR